MKFKYSGIILAGGQGTRLRPLTLKTPKPLIEIGGKPIISYIVNSLSEIPYLDDIKITISYLKEEFKLINFPEKVTLLNSAHCGNMYCSFIQAIQTTENDNIIGLSSDVFIETPTFYKAIFNYENSSADICVFLKKYNSAGQKKWNWKLNENNELVDIEICETETVYEKFMIILNKNAIIKLTMNYSINLGNTTEEFISLRDFNSGWIYLLKRLKESALTIKVIFLEDLLLNLNTMNDLNYIREYIVNSHSSSDEQ